MFVRRGGGADGLPTLFVHGNPTSSEDWAPFLERLRGPGVAVDLPGWGRTPPPGPPYDGSLDALAAWLGEAMDALVPGRFALVVHDWGGAALIPAIARAERVAGLVVMNSVPLLAGYRWHWVARLWRRRGVGEAVLKGTTRPGLALLLRQRRGGAGPAHPGLLDVIERARGPHTDAAILRLYRSADEPRLALAGRHLARLTCPALVVWGDRDPYLPPRFGPAYAAALPGARLREVAGAGHWPWLDRPELVDEVVAFLDALPLEG